jgi:hypothetical protein
VIFRVRENGGEMEIVWPRRAPLQTFMPMETSGSWLYQYQYPSYDIILQFCKVTLPVATLALGKGYTESIISYRAIYSQLKIKCSIFKK